MAGVLQFALGLETSNFLRGIGLASGQILSLASLGQLLQSGLTRMWDAVEQGGRLTDLAASASMTVGELYQLQQAFVNVGAAAEQVPGVISRFRINLGGGNQDDLLKRMGLDPEALRAMGVAQQFESVTTAMARMDAVSRAAAGNALFGREGAAAMQMIANSGDSFATAMDRAAEDAQVWQQVSATFDNLADRVTEIRAHIRTVAAQVTGTIIGAWENARMVELITLTFQAGMEKAVQIFQVATGAMAEIFAATLGAQSLWDGLRQVIASMFVGLGTSLMELLFGPIADLVGDREGFNQRQQERAAYAGKLAREGVTNLQRGGNEAFPAIMASLQEAFANLKLDGPAAQALKNFSAEMLASLDQGLQPEAAGAVTEMGRNRRGGGVEFTALEKMGGIISGLGLGFGSDYARATAENTRRTSDVLNRIYDRMGTGGGELLNA